MEKMDDYGLAYFRGVQAEGRIAKYAKVLEGIPAKAVIRSCEKMTKGLYERDKRSLNTQPSPQEWAKYAREEAQSIQSAFTSAKEKARQIEELREFQMGKNRTPEEQERITARVAAARAANLKVETLESMDDEKVDYFRRISGLRDRGGITEEQRAMQRRVAMEIDRQDVEQSESAE